MTKDVSSKKSQKSLFIIIAILVLAIAALLVYLFVFHQKTNIANATDETSETSQQSKTTIPSSDSGSTSTLETNRLTPSTPLVMADQLTLPQRVLKYDQTMPKYRAITTEHHSSKAVAYVSKTDKSATSQYALFARRSPWATRVKFSVQATRVTPIDFASSYNT